MASTRAYSFQRLLVGFRLAEFQAGVCKEVGAPIWRNSVAVRRINTTVYFVKDWDRATHSTATPSDSSRWSRYLTYGHSSRHPLEVESRFNFNLLMATTLLTSLSM
jgi:hypothetical protein